MRSEDNSAFIRLCKLLRPYWGHLVLTLALMVLLTGTNLVFPQLIGAVFDRVIPDKEVELLWGILGSILLLYLMRNLVYYKAKTTAVMIGENVCFSLRKRLFERLQQMNLMFYRRSNPGSLSSRVMNDSTVLQQFIQDDLPTLLQSVLLFFGIFAVIYAMNWQLALVSTVILPLHIVSFYYFKRPIKQASRNAQEHLAEATGNLVEKFLGFEVVKGFTGEERENRAFEEAIDRSRQSQLSGKRYHVIQKVVADLIIGLGLIFLLGFGVFQVIGASGENALQVGEFIAFFFYIRMLYPSILEMMSGFSKLTKVTASVERAYETLEAEGREMVFTARLKPAIQGDVQFCNVSFAYEDKAVILENISFDIKKGQTLAIIGPSGSGKSTLVSMLPRFLSPTGGTIYVDGTDVRQFDLRHLRESIGVVFQETFLFSSSVIENLRYAKPDATRAEIMEICRRTGAHAFIERLPAGYDTVVGDKGVALSRGQKQQITVSRAMLKNPKILILDEATASIDNAHESRLIPAILDFMKGKTTLMITHRSEMLRHADRVLQIDNGLMRYFGPQYHELEPSGSAGLERPVRKRSRRGQVEKGLSITALAAAGLFGALSAQEARAQDNKKEQPPVAPKQEQQANQPPAGLFLAQPGLNTLQLREILDVVEARARAELGYSPASGTNAEPTPATPPHIQGLRALSRTGGAGTHILQFGYRPFVSQPPHVWIFGQVLAPGGSRPNPDVPKLREIMESARKGQQERQKALTIGDLATDRIKLSHIEHDRAAGILKSLGYQVIEFTQGGGTTGKTKQIKPTGQIDLKKLPAVMVMPDPTGVDLVGGSKVQGGAFGVSITPSVAGNIDNLTSSAPMMEFLVYYDPAQPEQFAGLKDRIVNLIDRPARQILLEALVLEVSETGLDKLGVQWDLEESGNTVQSLRFGQLNSLFGVNDANIAEAELNNILGEFDVQIEALVEDGEAEILSRPSVLTLDGRQASIRVGEDIPIATTVRGATGGDFVQLDFKYIATGILLNVRPRTTAAADSVSLQIDGIISAEVPGEDVVITGEDGQELGRAPRISARRVQTYSMVANNTPFIIGGLISEENVRSDQKVPLLGDIPLLGNAFRNSNVDTLKREVIIVLTPFVLPEAQIVGRNLPKDEDAFDSFGNQLFRDAYRIRSEDVFDLSFLTENEAIERLQQATEEVLLANDDLRDDYPYASFANNRLPGEEILVYRQIYEVIKRRSLSKGVEAGQILYFVPDDTSERGFSVSFLDSALRELAGSETTRYVSKRSFGPRRGQGAGGEAEVREFEPPVSVGDALGDQALALIFYPRREALRSEDILFEPVPEVELIELSPQQGESAWKKLLWELNQPDEDGRERAAIVLHSQDDIKRLKRAILLKEAVELNASNKDLTLDNFAQGRLLLLPGEESVRERNYLVDAEVARLFFYTEHYYPALQQELQEDMRAMRQILLDMGRVPPPDANLERLFEQRGPPGPPASPKAGN